MAAKSHPVPKAIALSPRDRIVAGARSHFLAHGFRGVTMDDLAAELGMSKKTLYAAFPSKTALVEAVLAQKFQDVERDLSQVCSAPAPVFMDQLHRLLECIQRHASEIHPPFLRDIRRDAPELFQFVEQRRSALIRQHFARVFEEGRRSGIIRKDIPVSMMIEILLGAVQSIMNPARMEDLGLTLREGLTTILSVVLEGIVTGKGRLK